MTTSGFAAFSSSVVRLSPLKTSEAFSTFSDVELQVKSWLVIGDVEASRPSHCAACGAAAHRGDGRLGLHGHGSRERTVWGPTAPHTAPALATVRVRRYRCTSCGAARTVQPAGLASRLRYSLSAIALSLMAWAVSLMPAADVRAQVSPLRIVGPSEDGRWRSLRRWARSAAALFGLPTAAATAPREQAARAAHLVRARGPTDAPEAVRVFLGAHAR